MGWHLQYEYSAQKSEHPETAYRYSPFLLTWQAEELHLAGHLNRAERMYQQALGVSPLHVPAWLGLAELYDDRGNRKRANELLDFVDSHTQEIHRWLWKTSLIAYRFGHMDILARNLPYAIRHMPGKTKNDAIRMAFSLWPERAQLNKHLGDQLPALFSYAVRTQPEQALLIWPDIRNNFATVPQQDSIRFINQRIAAKDWQNAHGAWSLFPGANLGQVYDSGFLEEPMQGAFGWRIAKLRGCRWSIEPAQQAPFQGNALHLHFTREANIQYWHSSQIIPVAKGGTYRVQGYWRSQQLSTDQRPFLELLPYACGGAAVRTEKVAPDTDWHRFQLELQAPAECQALLLRIRRLASIQIDNRLGGDFWLAQLQLSSLADE